MLSPVHLRYWFAAVVAIAVAPVAQAGFINGGFEDPSTPGPTLPGGYVPNDDFRFFFQNGYSPAFVASNGFPANQYAPGPVAGWATTAPDRIMELWGDGFLGVRAYEGRQFAELNAFSVSTLYQDVTGIQAGRQVGFQFAHRGRLGVDTLRLTITDLGADGQYGSADDTILYTGLYADGNTAWGFYTNMAPLTAKGNTVRFAYESVSAAGGNQGIGNFLDDVNFGVGVGNVAPTPTPAPPGLVLLASGCASWGVVRLRRGFRRD